jgi:site-specific recombinase XerD
METKVSRIVLREFALTETCDADAPGATRVDLPDGSSYYIRPKFLPSETVHPNGSAVLEPRKIPAYPIVITGAAVPWDEANAWLLNALDEQYNPNIATYRGKADDLQHYRNFVDSRNFDWLAFPDNKLLRPTYRYRGFLRVEIETGGLEWSTARRRMSTVVHFYRWLLINNFVTLDNPPWSESEVYIPIANHYGRATIIKRKTADVSIRNTAAENPYDERIEDGGKLRPLAAHEQAWIMEALSHLRNTEQTLIHVLALTTGARIQTILTIRKRHILFEYGKGAAQILCGPGTGIDTKGDKRFTIQIPRWLLNALRTYVLSERAAKRRTRAPGGDIDSQYVFLSERSAPMYEAKQNQDLSGGKKLRHVKNGQAVRAYMKEFITPYIRKYHDPQFNYRFHDLRASFGMNLVDELRPRMDALELTYSKVLQMVQSRMCHNSPVVTERYLNYRQNRKLYDGAQDKWEEKIEAMVTRQMGLA